VETDTQDSEGATLSESAFGHVSLEALEAAAASLVGDIMQRPPVYSALRRDGKRLYDLARAGEIAELDVEERQVTVYALRVSSFDEATGTFTLRVRCSGGTYVRTLIVSIGRAVQSAAHMTGLRRTTHGPFELPPAANDDDDASVGADGLAGLGAAAGLSGEQGAAQPVRPVTEAELGDAERLIEAMAEASAALSAWRSAEVQRVGELKE